MEYTRMVNFLKASLLALTALGISACMETKPKVLGDKSFSFGGNDTTTPDTFKFNFASRDPDNAKLVYLQASTDTKSSMISACNSAGTNCVCEFLDEDGEELEETNSTRISYDTTGNYFRCQLAANQPDLHSIRIRNQNSTVISTNYEVLSIADLTVQKLIGTELDVNRVRAVYRYECMHKFLQKTGTTSIYFDCTSSNSLCSTGGGNFCTLRSYFPYYLYSDAYSTNFNQKLSDKLYYEGAGGNICGLQIKQFDCATTRGTPVAQFALYGQAEGIFETAVQLPAGPGIVAGTYGYAAKFSTINIDNVATKVCPPGLELRVFYETTTSPTNLGTASNYPASILRQIDRPTNPSQNVDPVTVSRDFGGNCNGVACTIPTSSENTGVTFTYAIPALETEFCVIPASLIP